MRQGKATYLFPGSNTSANFLSFYRDGLHGLDNVFILKGGPGCGKSTILRQLGQNMLERGYDVEMWQCSSDNDSLDGVLIPALSAAVVDGTPPHALDPQYPGAVEELVDLGQYWRGPELRRHKDEIIDVCQRISEKYSFCYARLREAGALLEREQEEHSRETVPEEVERQARYLTERIFIGCAPHSRHLFCSAVTPRGLVSFSEPLSRRFSRRFLLAGPMGGGKEQLLAELARLAEERGHKAEIFHPCLAPDRIELLCLPYLDAAVLACEEPPAEPLPGDQILLLGQHTEQDMETRRQAEQQVEAAAAYLGEAKALHDQLESYYRRAMDFPAVEAAGNQLLSRLLALAAAAEKA